MNYQCDVCGRFIAIDDLNAGKASRQLVTPDSELSFEDYDTLCEDHMYTLMERPQPQEAPQ